MQQRPTPGTPYLVAPSFYLTERNFVAPRTILLATIVALAVLSLVGLSLRHTKQVHPYFRDASAGRVPNTPVGTGQVGDDDDSSHMDTVYLGDLADPPSPTRPKNYVNAVHPFIVVRLPRFGNQLGLIPDTPVGHLLFKWLVAFNHADGPALRDVLPMGALSAAAFEQIELRRETGGLDVLSATEVRPGVLVFRLRDQTPAAKEILGTLQVRSDIVPPAIATFSLRAVPTPGQDTDGTTAPTLVALPEHRNSATFTSEPMSGTSSK